MAYSVGDDVKKAYRRIDTAGLVPDELEFFSQTADSVINGKIAKRYVVPISPTPPLLKTISIWLAIYYFTLRQDQGSSDEVRNWAQALYDQMIALLDQIASGEIVLVNTSGTILAAETFLPSSDTEDHTPTFGIEDDTLQVIDPDRLDERSAAKD